MAVIKKLKSQHLVYEQHLIRNCFERFDDNLIEGLIKYLSFDDKLKFQFVSKQWMRTVFHREKSLNLKPIFLKLFNFYSRNINGNKNNIINAIEFLLITCSEIKEIIVDFDSMNKYKLTNELIVSFFEKLLFLLADNCKHLNSIQFKGAIFNSCNLKVWQYFGRKCGKKILNADIYELKVSDCREFLHQCPNLKSLEKISLFVLIDETNIKDIFAPKLNELKNVNVYRNDNWLKLFVRQYSPTLTSLGIKIQNNTNNRSLSYISKLKRLQKLDLTLINCSDTAPNYNCLKQIADNCHELNQLQLCLNFENNIKYSHMYENTMKSLKHFTRLNKLEIITRNSAGKQSDDWENNLFLPNMFKKCAILTHLTIKSNIKYRFFTDIHLYLPHINKIRIETYFSLSDKSLQCLTKLNELKVLVIIKLQPFSDNLNFTDEGVCDLIDSCLLLHSIVFKPIPQITMKTIEKIINVAIDRNDTRFYYYFEPKFDSVRYCNYTQNIVDGIRSLCCLPKNLTVIVE